ncbi:hypothetical protein EVAR_17380_1 [Eumeta japonica]|uniref:Uncharacterized protein n=1 Tax=Eumeta variegata TaxID=151549 RepID=A0A4C1WID7_EUMVA|nr:hypothetical protein EVAR_17380_1 [Eumeta japonica]
MCPLKNFPHFPDLSDPDAKEFVEGWHEILDGEFVSHTRRRTPTFFLFPIKRLEPSDSKEIDASTTNLDRSFLYCSALSLARSLSGGNKSCAIGGLTPRHGDCVIIQVKNSKLTRYDPVYRQHPQPLGYQSLARNPVIAGHDTSRRLADVQPTEGVAAPCRPASRELGKLASEATADFNLEFSKDRDKWEDVNRKRQLE